MLYRLLPAALLLALACAAPLGLGRRRARRFKQHRLQLEADPTCPGVEERWFTGAVVDNYADVDDQQLWSGSGQRYFYSEQFWGGPGYPIFVMIGGESAESCSGITERMYINTLAQQHKALLLDLEHRFYGKSYPTTDMTNENMKYLTSAQALADLARFITWIKEDLGSQDSSVITFGGSYPGNLAAWFRLKYPHITDGSVASSGPVTAKEDFSEYMDVVGSSLKYFGGNKCYNNFKAAADAVQAKIDAGDLATLQTDFKTCTPISLGAQKDKDIATFLSMLMGNVQGTVQYNLLVSSWMTITDICDIMAAGSDPYTQFVALNDAYLEMYEEECVSVSYQEFIDELSVTTFDEQEMYRQWYYQTCNEFGYYQTTNSPNQPFYSWKHLDLAYYTDVCSEVYGITQAPQTSWINSYYGATSIAGTNIVFPTGSIDPWYILGVTDKTKLKLASEHSLMITGTAHCADMYAPKDTDTTEMKNAHQTIADLVSKFLTETGDGGVKQTQQSSKDKSSSNGRSFGSTVVIIASVTMGVIISLSGGYYFHRKVQELDARPSAVREPLLA